MSLTSFTLSELCSLLETRKIKAEEVVTDYLKEIEEKDRKISAYITVLGDLALEKAKKIDQKKERGILAGVPLALKDNLLTKGVRTTCASRILQNFIAPYNATVVEKLEKEDAIIIGKTNMDEFAMGSSTENSAFFTTKNPWDLERVPGGSSGGSAAAVASNMAAASLGSDTGGSIRQPAALCGLVGLKPTYGLVSRYGLVAFASSLDQIGPLTRTVEDCAVLTKIIGGFDAKDSTSSCESIPDYQKEMMKKLQSLKIAFLQENMLEGIDEGVKEMYYHTLKLLEQMGAELYEMDFPSWDYALACYYIIAPSEASSNLARYDGVRYGYRQTDSPTLKEMYVKTRTEGFGPEVKRRILLGTFALSSGYYEAYYVKAARTRRLITQEFMEAFNKVDYILTPTTPEPAFLIGAKEDPIAMYLSDKFTVSANLAGIPALSLPVGWSEEGLPIGLQIIGNFFQESRLFKLAFAIEKKVKFRKQN